MVTVVLKSSPHLNRTSLTRLVRNHNSECHHHLVAGVAGEECLIIKCILRCRSALPLTQPSPFNLPIYNLLYFQNGKKMQNSDV